MNTHPKRYSQNKYKKSKSENHSVKMLIYIRRGLKVSSLLHLKYLKCHLQCKNKREYNTQKVTYANAECTYNKSNNRMIEIPVYIVLPDKIGKFHTEPLRTK